MKPIPLSISMLLTFLLMAGCFRSRDSGTDAGGKVEAAYHPAPDQIDPVILKDRLFKEAPMLTERVNRGELPPASERLPENPLIVKPYQEIGQYGGEIRRAIRNEVAEETGMTKTLNDSLTGYERPFPNSIEPNLAESWEYQDGGKTVLFHIRKGVKWSDGHPFTVDDILFWYYDMAFDEEARTIALFPSLWLVDGKPMKMEKVDDVTLKVSGDKPLGRVIHAFAFDDFAAPRHVYAPFHPRYNPEATYEQFKEKTGQANLIIEPGIPRVSAWVPIEWVRGQRVVYERNPYYWKVDTEGNQLPYADRLVFTTIEDPQLIFLQFSNQQLDFFGRYSQPNMLSSLKGDAKRGNYTLHRARGTDARAIHLNWDAPDPRLREAFRNRDVRIALSVAINREEIKEIVYNGNFEPCGYSLSYLSPYYSEEASKRFSEFDPKKAASLLDGAGYIDADGDGYREFHDGSRFEITMDVTGSAGQVDMPVLISDYWEDIGIKIHLKIGRSEIIYNRRLNGEFEVYVTGVGGASDPMARPNGWIIMTPKTPWWHRNASTEGPAWLKESSALLHEAMTTVDEDRLRELMVRFRDLHTENVPVIVVGFADAIWGANNRVGNVPDEIGGDDIYRGWARPIFHEQLFIRK